MTKPRFLTWTAVLSAVLLTADLATKALAESLLGGARPVEFLGGLIILVFTRNEGAFLSLGSAFAPWARLLFLIIVPVAAVVGFVAWLALRARPSRSLAALSALFLAGSIGNLAERIVAGSVRDFMNFGLGGLRTGVLNVADLYLTAAIAAFAILSLKDS